nr:S41 family peptidase [Synergistales bacterium]
MKGLSKKNIFRVIFICSLLILAGAVFADNTGDFTDFSRIAPFEPKSLWLMKQAKSIIETYHVDSDNQDISEEDLVYGALKGMVAAWGDPYTRFVDPEILKDEEIEMRGEYGGLGIYIGQRDGMIVVISPIEDTPADRAGIKPQDQIVKIGEEMVIGWEMHDVVKKLRGRPGTSVTVWMRREGEDELLKFDIVRENIVLESVRYEMLPEHIGYIRISQFKQQTAQDVASAVSALTEDNARALIVDLRNNGGGL